ncbi:MAG: FAD binding domain-containing protein [Acidobacteria bacterium]|nr:FAD binding domain-containing protein [Acidobacteriota bacterium]
MMPLRRFRIHQPGTIAEAAEMLAHFGESGRLYAGGTELLLAMKHDVLRFEHLVDVKTVPGLAGIEANGGWLRIGGVATHRSIEISPVVRQRLPLFAEMEAKVANGRVRATGTLAGNLCFAEPHSDPATLLLALEARVRVEGRSGPRTLTIQELIPGAYQTSLASDEILTAVEIPLPKNGQRASYLKFQVHERPTLGLALVMETQDRGQAIATARVAVGCVCPFPRRSRQAESLLVGDRPQVERNLSQAAEVLADEADLIDDLEGGADYKRHLISVFLKRAFACAFPGR